MASNQIAKRYAMSLVQLATERNSLDQAYTDLLLFNNTLKQNRDLLLMLKSPVIKSLRKLNTLKIIFEGKVSVLTIAFFTIVCKKEREALLPEVADAFIALYNDINGIQVAEVVSAGTFDAPLIEAFKALIAKASKKSKVELTTKTDPDLIGGFVVKINDTQIDTSIKTALRKIKSNLND